MSNIYDQQLAAGRILALTPAWQRKEQKALNDITEMLRRSKSPYVALSWGKQSTCLMHMVFRVAPHIPGLFFREVESDIIANFNEIIAQFRDRWPIIYYEEMYYPWDENGQRDSHRKAAERWATTHGADGVFIGFARHESKARRYTLAKVDKNNIFEYKDGFLRCTPLRLWSDDDIAAYVAKYDIPMLDIYHRFGFQARTSAGLTPGTHSEIGFDTMTPRQKREVLEEKKQHGRYKTTENHI